MCLLVFKSLTLYSQVSPAPSELCECIEHAGEAEVLSENSHFGRVAIPKNDNVSAVILIILGEGGVMCAI